MIRYLPSLNVLVHILSWLAAYALGKPWINTTGTVFSRLGNADDMSGFTAGSHIEFLLAIHAAIRSRVAMKTTGSPWNVMGWSRDRLVPTQLG